MLFLLWVLIHFLILPTIYRRVNTAFFVLIFLFTFILFLVKEPSYDLVTYLYNISSSDYVYEPVSNLFLYFIEIISAGLLWLAPINITMALLLLNVAGLVFIQPITEQYYRGLTQIFLAICVVSLSLYFFLGSQNVVRQCLSISFFILFIAAYTNKQRSLSFSFLALSAFSHYGNFPVIFLLSLYFLTMSDLSSKWSLFLGIIVGSIGFFALQMLNFMTDYFTSDFSLSEERTSLFIKWSVLTFSVISTTYLCNQEKLLKLQSINVLLGLRCLLLGIITAIFAADLNEMFSRVAVNLYACDMMLTFSLLNSKSSRNVKTNLALIILISSSAIAPNVFQILLNN